MNRNRAIAVVVCALVALAVAVVFTRRPSEGNRPLPAATPAAPGLDGSEDDPRPDDPVTSTVETPLRSGGTLAVSRGSLASGEPLVVRLQLAQPEAVDRPLSGRIVTEGRAFDLAATVGGDASDVARVEIDADLLTPGRYIIEIRTSERSHFPLRRYALEVH